MKKKKFALYFIIVVIAILAIGISSINVIVDYQWFKELGYLSVYFKKLVSIAKLMVPIFLITFIAITLYYISLRPSIRKSKKIIEINKKQEKKKLAKFSVFNALISLVFSYVFSSTYWYKILEFSNSTNFNLTDQIFHSLCLNCH